MYINEKWKDIVDFKGFYKISNFGRIKRLLRKSPRIYKNKVRTMIFKELIIKQNNLGRGYLGVTLVANRKKLRIRVHQLVGKHFIKNPMNKPFINHKDGNTSNNNVDNLEWCTQSENLRHCFDVLKHGRLKVNPNYRFQKQPKEPNKGLKKVII